MATTAGACATFTVTFVDNNSNPVAPPAGTTVTLTSTAGGVQFYSGTGCTQGVSSVLATGASTTIGVTATVAQTTPLSAASSSLTAAANLVVNPGPPAQLRVAGPVRARMGACVEARLLVEDAFGNAALFNGQINVSSSTMPVGVSQDGSCMFGGPTATVTAMAQSQVPVWVFSFTPATSTINATASFANTSFGASFLPGVTHGTCTLFADETTRDCAAPAWLTPDSALVLVTSKAESSNAADVMPWCALTNAGGAQVMRCQRASANVQSDIAYQVVPMPTGWTVRRGSANCSAPSTPLLVPAGGQAFTLVHATLAPGDFSSSTVWAANATGSGVTVQGNCLAGTVLHAQQLATMSPRDQNMVQMGGAVTSLESFQMVPLDHPRTVSSVSWAPQGLSSFPCQSLLRSDLQPGMFTHARPPGTCSERTLDPVVEQRVLLPDGFVVDRIPVIIPDGELSWTLANAVTAPQDVAVFGLNNAAPSQAVGTNDNPMSNASDVVTRVRVNGRDINVERARGLGKAQLTLQVIRLPPP